MEIQLEISRTSSMDNTRNIVSLEDKRGQNRIEHKVTISLYHFVTFSREICVNTNLATKSDNLFVREISVSVSFFMACMCVP
jgi:hypothetical protein